MNHKYGKPIVIGGDCVKHKRKQDMEEEEDIVFKISGKKTPGVWIPQEEYDKFHEAFSDLVEKVEKLLLDSIICLGRHAKNEWSKCPSCVAEYNIKASITKAKAVLGKEIT